MLRNHAAFALYRVSHVLGQYHGLSVLSFQFAVESMPPRSTAPLLRVAVHRYEQNDRSSAFVASNIFLSGDSVLPSLFCNFHSKSQESMSPRSNACSTCRSRKVKCDRSLPRCSACRRLNLDCVQQGAVQGLIWLDPGVPNKTTSRKCSTESPEREMGLRRKPLFSGE